MYVVVSRYVLRMCTKLCSITKYISKHCATSFYWRRVQAHPQTAGSNTTAHSLLNSLHQLIHRTCEPGSTLAHESLPYCSPFLLHPETSQLCKFLLLLTPSMRNSKIMFKSMCSSRLYCISISNFMEIQSAV